MPKIIATAEVTNDHDQYSSRIRINKHELLVDEPLNNGGADLAPAQVIISARLLLPARQSLYACTPKEKNGKSTR